jgi:hypothetical protein
MGDWRKLSNVHALPNVITMKWAVHVACRELRKVESLKGRELVCDLQIGR